MPTVHNWNGASEVFLYDPARYSDQTSFSAGDTLVVGSGHPSVASSTANVAVLTTGAYQFTPASGAVAGLDMANVELDPASTLSVIGPGTVEWFLLSQFYMTAWSRSARPRPRAAPRSNLVPCILAR